MSFPIRKIEVLEMPKIAMLFTEEENTSSSSETTR